MKRKHSHFVIRDIWALESVQHGDSGLINESVLGDTCMSYSIRFTGDVANRDPLTVDCTDYSRDILNFLLWYMPDDNFNGAQISSSLPRLSSSEADQRARFGFRNQKVVGVGHSIGACGL